MADAAPYTGAPSRASENTTTTVPSQNITGDAQSISVEGEAIDAMILGVETMLESQRVIMRSANTSDSLCDNELWSGAAVLLSIVRQKANAIERMAQGIEIASMRANQAAVA